MLASYAASAGNFKKITEQVLSKIGPENSKMTYYQGPYSFHYILDDDEITYMCIADNVSRLFTKNIYV